LPDEEQPTDEELVAELEEQLRKLKVSDVLVETVLTVSSLGFRKLAAEDRDLDQARLAIESLRALLPVLEEALPDDANRDFGQMVANLQLAYAKAVAESGGGTAS
jgi:hypothetical protein